MQSSRKMVHMSERLDPGLLRVLELIKPVELARELGVTRSAVSQWERVPLERVHDVARVTGLSAHDIRPDFFRQTAA